MGKLYNPDKVVITDKPTTNNYAVDLAYKVIDKGVVYNVDVIKQSITNIILTMMGERLFNLQFGTDLYGMVMNTTALPTGGEVLKQHLIDRVLTYEKRVNIIEDDSYAIIGYDTNSVQIRLSFMVKESAELAVWDNTIYL